MGGGNFAEPGRAREVQIREESQRASLYADAPVGSKLQNPNEREVGKDVTPEQKERVDQALGKGELSTQIGGANDAEREARAERADADGEVAGSEGPGFAAAGGDDGQGTK